MLATLAIPLVSHGAQQVQPKGSSTSQPATAPSPLQRAEELIQQGLFEQAKEIIDEQLKLNPSSVEALNLLGIVYTDEKNMRDADRRLPARVETGSRLHQDSQQPRQSVCHAAETRPRRKRIRESPEPRSCESGRELQPGSASPGEGRTGSRRFRIFNEYVLRPSKLNSTLCALILQAERTAEALKTAARLSAAHKQDVQLHFTLGVLLAAAKQYKPAQLELEQANALQPETFEILHNLGQAYIRGHEYAKADLA